MVRINYEENACCELVGINNIITDPW